MPLRVMVDDEVETAIATFTAGNQSRYLSILSDLKDLGLEPEPDSNGWRATSTRVGFLCSAGYNVRRLTLKTNLPGHRFFYLHDEAHRCVFVMEVVARDANTYDRPGQGHIKSVMRKYDEYFGRELWKLR